MRRFPIFFCSMNITYNSYLFASVNSRVYIHRNARYIYHYILYIGIGYSLASGINIETCSRRSAWDLIFFTRAYRDEFVVKFYIPAYTYIILYIIHAVYIYAYE